MDARFLRAFVALAALSSLGASARTEHFLVTAPDGQLAKQVARAAEQYRRDLAIKWLGKPLGPWADICPIQVVPNRLASGETSFVFPVGGGHPREWRMIVEGTPERILDSVLPHEILHTVFATHFQNPLPRWADEGACTTVEHFAERKKHDHMLIRFLTGDDGIPFNKMFKMREYPRNILPLYSQGYSVARFLIAQGGERKFVKYVGEGMRTNNWTATTRKYYGFESLSDLQTRWVGWVGKGSPQIRTREPETLLAGGSASAAGGQPESAPAQPLSAPAQPLSAPADRATFNSPPATATAPLSKVPGGAVTADFRDGGDGWYARTARAARVSGATAPPVPAKRTAISRARHFAPAGQTIIQWSRNGGGALRR